MTDFDPNEDPLAELLRQLGINTGDDGAIDSGRLLNQLQAMMRSFSTQMAGFGPSESESGINWSFARDAAKKAMTAAAPGSYDPKRDLVAIRDAVSLADMWLDDQIAFPALGELADAWSPENWLDATFPTWQELLRPVVTSLNNALQNLAPTDSSDPMVSTIRPMLRSAAAAMQAGQIGTSLGKLATATLSASDTGLPLTAHPHIALLPANIARFTEGLDADPADVRLFLALRESARARLFAANAWLGPQLHALVQHFAREITIDAAALENQLEEQLRDLRNIADLQNTGNAAIESLFSPTHTPEQEEILERLETLLALLEGWVDEVVEQITRERMPAGAGLIEMMRRRRASGGPAETSLKTLVGTELRPRRTRDAANLWAAVRDLRGKAGRDELWKHPDFLPEGKDLSNPLEFAENGSQSAAADPDFDAALAKLLDESDQ